MTETVKLDYKKEYKDLYLPKAEPAVIEVPAMNFIMVDGKGDPNTDGGEYQKSVELLYALSYTIKMGFKKKDLPKDYFDYVVPPLEGLWWLAEGTSADSDFSQKEKYCWTSMIRQPEFITKDIFDQACLEVRKKKPDLDPEAARLEILEEGRCVQMMHLGPYDEESKTIAEMDAFIKANHYQNAIGDSKADGSIRRHHEIYLGDPRKTEPSKMKTVLRHPIK
ncbi:MAG: GyrI-like domain-containing protein [Bacillota bacterium]